MTTHYNGSKGPILIADMLYPHLLNARDKLVREQKDGARQVEIDAMTARLAEIDAMAEEEAEA
jgi:hypothetical protein